MSKSVPEEAGGPVLRRDLKSYESLMNVIRSRRSIRRFDPKPVPEEDLVRILEAGRWAPSGANIQPWAFIVVEESDRRRAIAELLIEEERYLRRKDPRFPAYDRRFHLDVPLFLIFACDHRAKRVFPQTGTLSRGHHALHEHLGRHYECTFGRGCAGFGDDLVHRRGTIGNRAEEIVGDSR